MATIQDAQYDSFASDYTGVVDLPCAKLECELVRIALGDCTGLSVLDLGGGTGIHARQAMKAGAALVDVFDISSEMLRLGREEEERNGGQSRIRWFQADATKPQSEQAKDWRPPTNGYDIVMVNWTFDNATTLEELRGMWENTITPLKSGGRFLGVRLRNIYAQYLSHGKYGNRFSAFEDVEGGVQYYVEALTKQPFKWECQAMKATYPVTNDIPRELGLTDFEELAAEETQVVRSDREFWHDFLEDPFLHIVTARKA